MLLSSLCDFLERLAPAALAAEWDNVGLLVGDRSQPVERVLTCLTITPAVAAEAIREHAGLIVTHHPLPFRPLKRLTTDEPTGRLLWSLIRAGVAIYSPHTAFDSAAAGINQQLAVGIGLAGIAPLVEAVAGLGVGRQGELPQPVALAEVAARLKQFLGIAGLHLVGDPARLIERVGIACGSAGDLLDAAVQAGCQLFITGEARLHTCYEAEARGVSLLLAGHYASERFAALRLAETLAAEFPTLTVWPSRDERDPLVWVS
ncbi:MAG: Nif3-like dinuclear metal center hexameric protein [Pirellulaceae bacterium]